MKKIIHLFLILILFFGVSCHQEQTISCTITQPKNGQEFTVEEDIRVSVEVESNRSIAVVHLYIDNICYSGTSDEPYLFTVKAEDVLPGKHKIKAVAQNGEGVKGETEITVNVTEIIYESPDSVSFAEGIIPLGWKVEGWAIDPTYGYYDNFSLFTQGDHATVTTNKTCTDIEFYLWGYGTVNLYIDGILTEKILMKGTDWGVPQQWKKYTFDFPNNCHSFKWEFFTNTGSASRSFAGLDAIKFTME